MLIGAGAALVVGGGAAFAHIDPVPEEVPAGTPVTVEFRVEHGCDDLDTTGMLFQIPAGLSDLTPVAKEGWTTSVAPDTVSFTGGVLDHHTEDTFALTFTAPSSAGAVDFPVVQQCGDTELRWIEIPQDGQEEPEHPAPRLQVVGEAPSATTTTGVAAATTTAAPATTPVTTEAPAEATTTSAELVIATAPASTDVAADPEDADDGGSSSNGWLIAIVAVVGVGGAAAGGAYLLRARSRGTR
ncbi:MAG: DUF1775 domain-containing protein [Acidimicrobiia bacterium]